MTSAVTGSSSAWTQGDSSIKEGVVGGIKVKETSRYVQLQAATPEEIATATATEWTVEGRLFSRNCIRAEWEKKFDWTSTEVVKKISESITTILLKKVRGFENPFSKLPTEKNPLKEFFSISLWNPNLKVWAGETAQMPPFKEWFEAFSSNDSEAKSNENEAAISLKKQVVDWSVDREYFENYMGGVGLRVSKLVEENLLNFAAKPENHHLDINVKWVGNEEQSKSVSSFKSSSVRNMIDVSMWIKKKVEPQSKQAEARSWSLEMLRNIRNSY